jgi:hypothetical protein
MPREEENTTRNESHTTGSGTALLFGPLKRGSGGEEFQRRLKSVKLDYSPNVNESLQCELKLEFKRRAIQQQDEPGNDPPPGK